ncbi:MAG TPA: CPBP family intramembrane glutamic endopeptidase [Planococcus sp. (in: firmicutes)]|nr:CPBP family intramembrane glutamic endopeptidase [Planococcus sp. (in: firmicutes)]
MMKKKDKPKTPMTIKAIFPFILISFGLTWGLASLMLFFNDQVIAIFGEISTSNPLYILAVYAPAIAAFILVWRYYGLRGIGSFLRRLTLWRMSLAWWLFLIFGTAALFYLASAITGTISDPFPYNPWHAVMPALVLMLLLGPVEEFGWRGLALPLLQRRFTPFWASIILGIIWGIWHLPAFLIGGTPQSEWVFVPFFIAAIALSIIMTAIFNESKGSILTAALFHFQLNNPIWPDAQPWDTILFSIVAVVIVIFKRRTMFTHSNAVTTVLYPGDEPTYPSTRKTADG